MKKWIKRIVIGLLVLVIALEGILQIYVWMEANKRKEAPGNAVAYNIENLDKQEDSSLMGKTILFLGSSVTEGAAAQNQSFVELFAYQDGVQVIKEAKSGTTLVDKNSILALLAFGNGDSYVKRIKHVDTDLPMDVVVCQLSTNDATMKKDLGDINASKDLEDFDTNTITGAMEYIIAYVKATWDCPVVFYTGSYYENKEYAAMVKQLYELQKKWDIGIIDLYTDAAFNDIDKETYNLYMFDEIHPTKAGYAEWWTPEMRKQLEAMLKEDNV